VNKEELAFIEVELARGVAVDVWLDWETARERVESAHPNRWYNPILIAVPVSKCLEFVKEAKGEGEIEYFGDLKELVVAVPDEEFGYGNPYRAYVERNREKFGLK